MRFNLYQARDCQPAEPGSVEHTRSASALFCLARRTVVWNRMALFSAILYPDPWLGFSRFFCLAVITRCDNGAYCSADTTPDDSTFPPSNLRSQRTTQSTANAPTHCGVDGQVVGNTRTRNQGEKHD